MKCYKLFGLDYDNRVLDLFVGMRVGQDDYHLTEIGLRGPTFAVHYGSTCSDHTSGEVSFEEVHNLLRPGLQCIHLFLTDMNTGLG